MNHTAKMKDHVVPLVASWFGLFFLISQLFFWGDHLMRSAGCSILMALLVTAITIMLIKELNTEVMRKVWMCSLGINVALAFIQFSHVYRMLQGG